MLIQTAQLDYAQQVALDTLCAECKQRDGNVVALYPHLLRKNRSRPANVLYYENDRLVGFLAAFFFQSHACEIGLMVAPAHRRLGIASQMIHAIQPLLESENVGSLIFSIPQGLYAAELSARGFHYQGSEYSMQRNSANPAIAIGPLSSVRPAVMTDIPTLLAIDEACFPGEKIGMPTRLLNQLIDPSVCLFLIHQNGVPVGKAHLNWQDNGARLSDIGVLPHAQGQGLGGLLLAHCIDHAILEKKYELWLDVEAKNQHALGLYTRLGFEIDNAHDYWCIDEFGLTAFLRPL
ncbi:MAG TPA: GNAT family N-acetyltransferase [Legionella sp.]|nr:GNAT family N-acetyltransferase [Legionella sp.]